MPTLPAFLLFWFKIGCLSFGGPAGQIALLHEEVVIRKRWLSDARFMEALNFCLLLPGPEAHQLCIYLGWLLFGTWGAVAAGVLFVLPALLLIWVLSIVFVQMGHLPLVQGLVYGLQSAVLAIVALALLRLAKKTLRSSLSWMVAFFAFLAVAVFKLSFLWVVAATLILGILVLKYKPQWLSASKAHGSVTQDLPESAYLIHVGSAPIHIRRYSKFWTFGFGALACVLPLFLIYGSGNAVFLFELARFFTTAALVTFGGAYAVLPYVAQYAVADAHWLSATEMMVGLSLGETTPGPLILVLAFVGFMAGYNHGGNALWLGGVGLWISAWYTFLPSFIFVLVGAPQIEKISKNKTLQQLMQLLSAAVVGVVAGMCIFFVRSVLWKNGNIVGPPDFVALFWAFLSGWILHEKPQWLIFWIIGSAILGGFYKSGIVL